MPIIGWLKGGVTRSILKWGFLFLYLFSSPKIELRLSGIGFGLLFAWGPVSFLLRIKHTGVEAENHASGQWSQRVTMELMPEDLAGKVALTITIDNLDSYA